MSVSVNLASIHDKLFQKLKHWRDASANYLEFKSYFNGLLDFSFLTLELKYILVKFGCEFFEATEVCGKEKRQEH
jgi:hypothetical protein